ncbi:MAG: hypothetical protein VKI63_00390, partial [Cyanobium sp.]|nr:hypothetical protein [Cyanobium sp.]
MTPAQLDCRMLGDTRDGECSLSLPPSAAGALSRHLKLEAIPADASTSSLSLLVQLKGPGCAGALSNPLERHGIEGRPDSLRLPKGAFEFLVLSFDPRSQRACLQVSYAYGQVAAFQSQGHFGVVMPSSAGLMRSLLPLGAFALVACLPGCSGPGREPPPIDTLARTARLRIG